jgi:hypothetical protein
MLGNPVREALAKAVVGNNSARARRARYLVMISPLQQAA